MSMWITGIGTAVPPHRIAQADASAIAQQFSCTTAAQERLFQTMYRRSGVESRFSAVLEASEGDLALRQSFFGVSDPSTQDRMRMYEAESGPLAVSAGNSALRDAGIPARAGAAAPGHGFLHRLSLPWMGHRADQGAGSVAGRVPHARRFHGLPRPSERTTSRARFRRGGPRGVRAALRGRTVQLAPPVRLGRRQDRRQFPLRGWCRGARGDRVARSRPGLLTK